MKGPSNQTEEVEMVRRYVGVDVHSASCSVCVLDDSGRVVQQSVLRTDGEVLVQFVQGLGHGVALALEEGVQSAWLYELLGPYADVVVCDPRKMRATTSGNKSDRIDALRIARQLRSGELVRVHKGTRSTRAVKMLALAYENIVQDHVRTKNRIKALYRGRGLDTTGRAPYLEAHRERLLAALPSSAHRLRGELLYRQLDHLAELKEDARREFLEASRKLPGWRVVETVPGFGPLRAAQFAAWVGSPHRFRTRRQLWSYAGLAVVRRGTGHYDRDLRRVRDPKARGLNRNYNRHLKQVLKSAAITAMSHSPDTSWKRAAEHHRERGLDPALVPVTLARRLGAIALHLWKTGAEYDPSLAFPSSRTSTSSTP